MRDIYDYSLRAHNTFGIEARCRRFIEFETEEEAVEVARILRTSGCPYIIIGGGSNLLLTHDFDGIVVRSAIKGHCFEDGNRMVCGSGETWDDMVAVSLEAGYYGMENFSAGVSATTGLLLMVAGARHMNPAQFEVSGFMSQGAEPDPDLPIYSGKDVLQWVADGEPVTCAVFDQWIKNLTMVVYNLKMTLDPEKIVIGGGISRNPLFMEALKKEYAVACEGLKMFGMPETELVPCRFTSDANLIGAVYNWKLQHE